jgi:hypothetical protein
MATLEPTDPQVLLASVGPGTSAVESIATSIGAGVLLGGFVVGALGTLLGWNPERRDSMAVGAGYLGGTLVIAVAMADFMG